MNQWTSTRPEIIRNLLKGVNCFRKKATSGFLVILGGTEIDQFAWYENSRNMTGEISWWPFICKHFVFEIIWKQFCKTWAFHRKLAHQKNLNIDYFQVKINVHLLKILETKFYKSPGSSGFSSLLSLNTSHSDRSRTEKITLNFYFHPCLWGFKRFYEGLKTSK